MGSHDEADEFAQIVSVFGKADCQVIKQILVPGLGVHRIDRMHDPTPHQAGPDAIHDGTGESSVFRMGHQTGQLLEPFRLRSPRIDLA